MYDNSFNRTTQDKTSASVSEPDRTNHSAVFTFPSERYVGYFSSALLVFFISIYIVEDGLGLEIAIDLYIIAFYIALGISILAAIIGFVTWRKQTVSSRVFLIISIIITLIIYLIFGMLTH